MGLPVPGKSSHALLVGCQPNHLYGAWSRLAPQIENGTCQWLLPKPPLKQNQAVSSRPAQVAGRETARAVSIYAAVVRGGRGGEEARLGLR